MTRYRHCTEGTCRTLVYRESFVAKACPACGETGAPVPPEVLNRTIVGP